MTAKKKATEKKTRGRPTKFADSLLPIVKKLTLRGFTDDEIAEVLQVTETTYHNWKKQHAIFFESIKDWKATADGEVERSLYERATGYHHPETKAQFISDPVFGGKWVSIDLEKHYPPDPTAMIFWLKNRQPKKWRDKIDHEVETGDTLSKLLTEIAAQGPPRPMSDAEDTGNSPR